MKLMQAVEHYATAMKLSERYGNRHGDIDAANNAWRECARFADALTAANERIKELEVREQDMCNALDIEDQEFKRKCDALTAERAISDKLEKALNGIVLQKEDELNAWEFARATLAEVEAMRKNELFGNSHNTTGENDGT